MSHSTKHCSYNRASAAPTFTEEPGAAILQFAKWHPEMYSRDNSGFAADIGRELFGLRLVEKLRKMPWAVRTGSSHGKPAMESRETIDQA